MRSPLANICKTAHKSAAAEAAAKNLILLLPEGLTVGTLIHGRICLMGTHQDPLQRAEICILAVMGALLNSTLNALVCMAIHSVHPPYLRDGVRLPDCSENIHFILR